MLSLPLQTILPFFLSALVVILIMCIAEKYGTKTGGILGTLPSTVVVAYIFISLNKGVDFASRSAAIVPAELGVNIIFLMVFVVFIHRSRALAFAGSLTVWAILSWILLYVELDDIYVSLAVYAIALAITIFILEVIKKIHSTGKVFIKYTPKKILFRGFLAGLMITITVLLSNIGTAITGIFSVFPVVMLSTMLISVYEHGPDFATGIAKSMIIGLVSILTYVVSVYFFYPVYGLIIGSLFAYCASIVTTLIVLKLRNKIR